jgi:hypothetical protein
MKLKEIENSYELQDVMQDMLYEFVESMYDDRRYFVELKKEDLENYGLEDEESVGMYLAIGKTQDMIDRYIDRMAKVFEANFPDEELDINSPLEDIY